MNVEPDKKKILIVDDNPADLKYVATVLEDAETSYALTTACTADDFRRKIAQEVFDLIILDINLDGDNGVELCRQVKSSESYHGARVIVASSMLDGDLIFYAKDAGADLILSKEQASEDWEGFVEVLLQLKYNAPARDTPRVVLIVEDDFAQQGLLRRHLEHLRYRVHCASSGHEALHQAATLDLDAVLLDAGLPDLSGFDVCRLLKGNPKTRSFPVIMLTGGPESCCGQPDARSGVHAYIAKPFDWQKLAETLETACRSKN